MSLTLERFEVAGAVENERRPRSLADAVEEAVEHVCTRDESSHTHAWKILLGVLTYFYARGVYSSEEIANAIKNDRNTEELHRVAFACAEPSVVLRNFRRMNRNELQTCLAQVFGEEAEATESFMRAVEADSFALDV